MRTNLHDIIDSYEGNFLADAISHGHPDEILKLVKAALHAPGNSAILANFIGHRIIDDCFAFAEGMDDPTAQSESEMRDEAEDAAEKQRHENIGKQSFFDSWGAP